MKQFTFPSEGENEDFILKQVESQALHQEGNATGTRRPLCRFISTPAMVCQVMDGMKFSLHGIFKRPLGLLGFGMNPAQTAEGTLIWRGHLGAQGAGGVFLRTRREQSEPWGGVPLASWGWGPYLGTHQTTEARVQPRHLCSFKCISSS